MNEMSPDVLDEVVDATELTELNDFTQEPEEIEHIDELRLHSILESILFATDRPLSLDSIRTLFKGTNIKTSEIRNALERLMLDYSHPQRGVTLEEVAAGYQIRTKSENADFMKLMNRGRPFKLSGPALEVLSIVAYKQPCVKSEIDEIRGVESGHLLRALMDRGLVRFAGKSELPGKPMNYETTRKFLEIFGLRNIRELPSPSEMESLIPEGIGEPEVEEKTLSSLTSEMSLKAAETYSEGEHELLKISSDLAGIETSTQFFEAEKQRQKEQRDLERARDIRESLMVGSDVDPKDIKWLERYNRALAEKELVNLGPEPSSLSEEPSTPEPTSTPVGPVTAILLCIVTFMSLWAQAEIMSLESSSRWHADIMERIRMFEKLHKKSDDVITRESYQQILIQLKPLEDAKTKKDEYIKFEGWQDLEYLDVIISECAGTKDWLECRVKMKAAGYPAQTVEDVGKVAADTQWKWVEIRERHEKMLREVEKDARLMKLNASHFDALRIMERIITRAEGDASLALRLGEVRKAMMKIYRPLEKFKDLDEYYDQKFLQMLELHQEKLCETLNGCSGLAAQGTKVQKKTLSNSNSGSSPKSVPKQ